ncbi:MAG: thrombospondin type 3 repeat-containing protein [Archangiaceae bacterium]|nr:thrombospondin type 3 repeat-containing protein [Archangiaceae bacterium]
MIPPRGGRLATLLVLLAGAASAQERGFAVDRLDPTAPGSRTFLVERGWYSSTRFFAAGLTVDYAHRALVPQLATGRGEPTPIVAHGLLGRVELAGALFDRLRLHASLPVSLFESGTPEVLSGAAPQQGVGAGDARLGVLVRLFGDAERDPLSLQLGLDAWVPLGAAPRHLGDTGPRFLPRLLAAGAFAGAGRWGFEGAFLWRPYASLGPPALGMTSAPELRLGLALGASLWGDRLYLGPEARFSTQVLGASAFQARGIDLELLAGLSASLGGWVSVGLAGGTALFSAAGTPDARVLVRVALAPRRGPASPGEPDAPDGPALARPAAADADHDGVPDALDRCPFEPENLDGVRDLDGCPEYAGDAGTALARVLTREPPPRRPTADAGVAAVDAGAVASLAFATADSDGDGVPDEADRCPVTREDPDGFEDEDGCPEPDNDDDGVADAVDRCPEVAAALDGDADGCAKVAPDADGDGVADAVDRCPLEPENVDGVRDLDGCPEQSAPPALAKLLAPAPAAFPAAGAPADAASVDSDGDGVDDRADRCPLTKEDPDGFEDEDGCPELDDDGDGILDRSDRCPQVAETFNGWQDGDGCPDEHGDPDSDGVEYQADRCPLEPGDASDGCPHLEAPALALAGFSAAAPAMSDPPPPDAATADFDRDGAPDAADQCPTSREDADGFEDEDGCPEPDNDGDGIDDAKDKCPFEAETINGNRDDDGCPDPGAAVVHVVKGAVVLDETVQFKTASATLQPASLKLLKQVAGVLRAARSLSIEIQGHTDDVGSAVTNIALSQKRAEAIRVALVKAGVAPARLRAKGFGPTRPRASNTTAPGREQNRRVEFLIIGEAK